jgi:hypothetical protein
LTTPIISRFSIQNRKIGEHAEFDWCFPAFLAALVSLLRNMRALLHFLSIGFATIEMEEKIEVRLKESFRHRKQFGFVPDAFGPPKRPFWTV